MMLKLKILVGLITLFCFSVVYADGSDERYVPVQNDVAPKSVEDISFEERNLEFYASDKAAQISYERKSDFIGVQQGKVTIGFLFDEKRDNLFSLGLKSDTTPRFLPGATLSFGGKAYAALLGVENTDVFGLGFGIEGAYKIPVRQFPLLLSAAVYYAPDILSFGQSNRVFDWQVRAGLQLRESLIGYVGFRYLQFDLLSGNRKLDNGVHIGIRWKL